MKEARMRILKQVLTEEQRQKFEGATDRRQRWKIANSLFSLRDREDLLTSFDRLKAMDAKGRESFLSAFLTSVDAANEAAPVHTGKFISSF